MTKRGKQAIYAGRNGESRQPQAAINRENGTTARRYRRANDLSDNHLGAPSQLRIACTHVHHQPPIDAAKFHHDGGRKQVQHNLLSRARLHACRARDHLRAGFNKDIVARDIEQRRGDIDEVGDVADLKRLGAALCSASLTPARFLGLEHERGALICGARADMVALTSNLDVIGTWIGGAEEGRSMA